MHKVSAYFIVKSITRCVSFQCTIQGMTHMVQIGSLSKQEIFIDFMAMEKSWIKKIKFLLISSAEVQYFLN